MKNRGCGTVVLLAVGAGVLEQAALGGFLGLGETIAFNDGTDSVVGTITWTQMTNGIPAGGLDFGNPPDAGDVTLAFRIEMMIGEISELGIGLLDENSNVVLSTGQGWIQNLNEPWADISGVDGTPDTPIFMFDPLGGNGGNNNAFLDAGETSDELFVSYDVAVPADFVIAFMITDGVPTFTHKAFITIPAPGALAFLGLGALAGIGRQRRQRR